MAYYQDTTNVTQKQTEEFKPTYKPGTKVPHSGIFMCINCRDEIAANHGDPFPPQNHRQHTNAQKPIEWQLLVRTQNGPPAE
jgi:hypothetical protein